MIGMKTLFDIHFGVAAFLGAYGCFHKALKKATMPNRKPNKPSYQSWLITLRRLCSTNKEYAIIQRHSLRAILWLLFCFTTKLKEGFTDRKNPTFMMWHFGVESW